MEKRETLSVTRYTKILVPASSYKLSEDKRLLVPFTNGEKIGFVNKEGEIVVKPQYAMYYGDCYDESDYIRVAVDDLRGFARKDGSVSSYKRPVYGLINSDGKTVFEPSLYSLVPAIGNKDLYTVQTKDYKYGVLRIDGTEVVPFGKYSWIDGFDNGLARVKIKGVANERQDKRDKWGLIDEDGNEILPVEYDEIWSFYGKNRTTTKTVKDNVASYINLMEMSDSNNAQEKDCGSTDYDDYPYGSCHGGYAGSYAQDVEGYSDDAIDDAFDSDPDAYWNID